MTFFFPDPAPVFPTLRVGYSMTMKPTFSTAVQTSVSGLELRSARQVYPLWEFELTFEVLRDRTQNVVQDSYYGDYIELQKLCGLFLACRGQYGRFLYSCPEDNSRNGQSIGTGNGAAAIWAVQRFWGTSQLAAEPVILDTTKPYTIYLNGSDDTGNWTVTGDGATITRSSPPADGDVITMDLYFFYLCRFIEDLQDFDQFYHHLWQVKSLKFRSVKIDVEPEYVGHTFASGASLTIGTPYYAFSNVPQFGTFYVLFQSDGNLVVYRRTTTGDTALWASGTNGMATPGSCIMQTDGNLVVYDSGSVARFASNTAGNAGATLVMQADGNLVIYSTAGVALWATNTGP